MLTRLWRRLYALYALAALLVFTTTVLTDREREAILNEPLSRRVKND